MLRSRLLLALVTMLAVLTGLTRAQDWSSPGGGAANWVYATTEYNGDLIIGGAFTSAGGVAANHIARWDGSAWSALGPGLDGTVWGLTVYNGLLIAVGDFVYAGSLEVKFIAAWDGTQWTDVEGGADSSVRTACVWNGKLIVGGYFTTCDVAANHVAQWDGSNWSALGAGTGGSQGQVMAVGTYGADLIAAGFFTTAGGQPANRIAKWNGSSWSPLGSGIGNIPYALTVWHGNLIVGGLFSSAGGVAASDVAMWNGTSWSALGSGVGGGVYGYCLTTTVLNDDLYVGGIFTTAGGQTAANCAKWNGYNWTPIATYMGSGGTVQAVYSLSKYGTSLAVGGIFNYVSGSYSSVGSGNVAIYNEAFSAYGPGSVGGNGLVPELSGIGIPAAGEVTGLAATNGRVFGQGAFVVGSDWASQTILGTTLYVGGTMLPAYNVFLDATGSVSLTTTLPAWVPTGTTVFCQFVSLDATAPNGFFALSNGLKMTFQ